MQQNIDSKSFRQALGTFPTGVTIITAVDASGADVGMTANSFNSVSLDPPLVLWSLARTATNFDALIQAKHFAVHVLAADQDELAMVFAQKGADRFAGLQVTRGQHDLPLLDGAVARFECRTAHHYEGGDHVIIVGEVLGLEHWEREPLAFKRGRFALAVDKTDAAPLTAAPIAKSYRVVQWATGNVGKRSLRAVIEHPRLKLVGVYVTSADKAGKDAGELCGLGPVGVKTTSSIDDVLALQPDCVLYMQRGFNVDDICRLLARGINVVATRDEVQYGPTTDPAVRARIEAACREGKSSIHATGSSPGFATEVMPLVLTSLSRRVDAVTIDEFADLSSRNSPQLLFEIMGFGRAPSSFDQQRLNVMKGSFGPSLHLVADALGVPLEELTVRGEAGIAREDTRIAAGVIEKGTVAATRITVEGLRNGRAFIRFRANWYCGTQLEQDWELRDSGWRVLVEGDTPLDVSIRFPVAAEDYAAFTPGLTAHRAVNAVPLVCEAAPGLRSSLDLSYVVPWLNT